MNELVNHYETIVSSANAIIREARRELEAYCEKGTRRLLGYGHKELDLGSKQGRFFEDLFAIKDGKLVQTKTSRGATMSATELDDTSKIRWREYRTIELKHVAERIDDALKQYENSATLEGEGTIKGREHIIMGAGKMPVTVFTIRRDNGTVYRGLLDDHVSSPKVGDRVKVHPKYEQAKTQLPSKDSTKEVPEEVWLKRLEVLKK